MALKGDINSQTWAEIQDLFARYNQASDDTEPESWAKTFTPTGVFDNGREKWSGQNALVAFMTTVRDEPRFGWARGGLHTTFNAIVVQDGDIASSKSDHMLMTVVNRQPQIQILARFHDELQRINGRWLFLLRRVEIRSMGKAIEHSTGDEINENP